MDTNDYTQLRNAIEFHLYDYLNISDNLVNMIMTSEIIKDKLDIYVELFGKDIFLLVDRIYTDFMSDMALNNFYNNKGGN